MEHPEKIKKALFYSCFLFILWLATSACSGGKIETIENEKPTHPVSRMDELRQNLLADRMQASL